VDRVRTLSRMESQIREAAVAAQIGQGRRRWSLAVCPGRRMTCTCAIAHGPPVTAPYWAIPYPINRKPGSSSLVCLERQTLCGST